MPRAPACPPAPPSRRRFPPEERIAPSSATACLFSFSLSCGSLNGARVRSRYRLMLEPNPAPEPARKCPAKAALRIQPVDKASRSWAVPEVEALQALAMPSAVREPERLPEPAEAAVERPARSRSAALPSARPAEREPARLPPVAERAEREPARPPPVLSNASGTETPVRNYLQA